MQLQVKNNKESIMKKENVLDDKDLLDFINNELKELLDFFEDNWEKIRL